MIRFHPGDKAIINTGPEKGRKVVIDGYFTQSDFDAFAEQIPAHQHDNLRAFDYFVRADDGLLFGVKNVPVPMPRLAVADYELTPDVGARSGFEEILDDIYILSDLPETMQ